MIYTIKDNYNFHQRFKSDDFIFDTNSEKEWFYLWSYALSLYKGRDYDKSMFG
jgi:hypothetical protein